MATKKPEPVLKKQEPVLPEKKTNWMLFGLIGASVLAVILLITALHISGALNGPEQKIYDKVSKNGFFRAVLGSFNHEDDKANSPEDAISIISLRKDMQKARNVIKVQKDQIKGLQGKATKVGSLEKKVKDLERKFKDMEEGSVAMTPAAPASPAVTRTSTPAALPSQGIPAQTRSAINIAIQEKDYRKVSKIVDAMASDQAVDVLKTLDQTDVVEILVLLKEKKAAEIIQAFEPAEGGRLFQMIMDRRGGA